MLVETQIQKANIRLKPLKISIQIQNDFLHLQATLPPKPKAGENLTQLQKASQKRTQQKIFPHLRLNPEGVKLAEALCREISGRLLQNTFDWLDYWTPPVEKSTVVTVAELIEAFKVEYFTDRDSPALRHTWDKHYLQAYKRLPQDEPINIDMLIECLNVHNTETRSRVVYFNALNKLVKFAELDYDLSKWKGTYSSKNLKVREIPNDDEIIRLVQGIKNPKWRWIYGMMATYGLRPHEAWNCDLDLPITKVHESTRTGARVVFPVPAEWTTLFDLGAGSPPPMKVKNNCDYGDRACKFGRVNNLPIPYTFRHAYALRMIHAGVPDSVAASWMGHDLVVHNKSSQRWLSKRDHLKIFNSINNEQSKVNTSSIMCDSN